MIQAVGCSFLSPFAKTCVLDFPVYDTKRRKADLAKDNSNSDAQILHIFYERRLSYASAHVCWLENTQRFGKNSWLLKGLQVGASKLVFLLRFHGGATQVTCANTKPWFSKCGVNNRL